MSKAMFRVAGMVPENKLGAFYRATQGIIVNMEPPQPVVFVAPGQNGSGAVLSKINFKGMRQVTSEKLKDLIQKAGGNPSSAGYYLKKLMEAKRLRKSSKNGVYIVGGA